MRDHGIVRDMGDAIARRTVSARPMPRFTVWGYQISDAVVAPSNAAGCSLLPAYVYSIENAAVNRSIAYSWFSKD